MATAAKHGDNEAGRRGRILAAARKLVAEHGLDATSTKAIAAEAGVPSGLVFYYFATKDALIEAIGCAEGPTVVENAIERARNRPLETLLRAVYDGLRAHRYEAQIMVAAVASSHLIAEKMRSRRRRAESALAEFFRTQAVGSSAVEPEVLAYVVQASILTAVLIDKPRDVASFVRGLASVVRSGLAQREPVQRAERSAR